jgi:predicted PurR-regulated permease PerM
VNASQQEEPYTDSTVFWYHRFVKGAALLVWIAIAGVVFWLAGRVGQALLLLILGALIAHILAPLVRFFQRWLPRWLSIVLVYILILSFVCVLLFFIISAAIRELSLFIGWMKAYLSSGRGLIPQPILNYMSKLGISQEQLQRMGEQWFSQIQGILSSIFPLLSNTFVLFINTVLVIMLSIYFLLSGPVITHWLTSRTPNRHQRNIAFVLQTTGRIIGGYIRGNLLLGAAMSILTGIGLFLLGVPYAFLLTVLAFVLEFVPVVGVYIMGGTIVLVALTKSLQTAVLALVLVILLQNIENNILAPRIIGRVVGLNPILTVFAIVAGTNLFGVAGAFLAAPVAAVLQELLKAGWNYWRETHPEQFQNEQPGN